MKSMLKTLAGLALLIGVIAVPLALGPRRAAAQAPSLIYNVTLTGTAKSLAGQATHFTASGTLSYDPSTGNVAVDITTTTGSHLTGTGIAGIGKNGTLFISLDVNADGATGTNILSGKMSKSLKSFTTKFISAIPAALGPAPGGFAIFTGHMSGEAA